MYMKKAIVLNMVAESNQELDDFLVDAQKCGITMVHLRQIGTSGGYPEYKFIGKYNDLLKFTAKWGLIAEKEEFDEFIMDA